jgi:hypothetical protein
VEGEPSAFIIHENHVQTPSVVWAAEVALAHGEEFGVTFRLQKSFGRIGGTAMTGIQLLPLKIASNR